MRRWRAEELGSRGAGEIGSSEETGSKEAGECSRTLQGARVEKGGISI